MAEIFRYENKKELLDVYEYFVGQKDDRLTVTQLSNSNSSELQLDEAEETQSAAGSRRETGELRKR